LTACPPGTPVGDSLQLAAVQRNALKRLQRSQLPAGWRLEVCTRVLADEDCKVLRRRIVSVSHMLSVPKLPSRPGATHEIRTLHVMSEEATESSSPASSSEEMRAHVEAQAEPQTTLVVPPRGRGVCLVTYDRVLAMACHAFSPVRQAKKRRCLMLGVGGGTGVRLLAEAAWEVTGVEISASVLTAARKHFGLPSKGCKYVEADALEYLRSHPGDPSFDCVCVDVFVDTGIGMEVITELLGLSRKVVGSDGILVVNSDLDTSELLEAANQALTEPRAWGVWIVPVPLNGAEILAFVPGGHRIKKGTEGAVVKKILKAAREGCRSVGMVAALDEHLIKDSLYSALPDPAEGPLQRSRYGRFDVLRLPGWLPEDEEEEEEEEEEDTEVEQTPRKRRPKAGARKRRREY